MSDQELTGRTTLRLLGGIALDGAPAEAAGSVLARPRLVAMLAFLACGADRFRRRDSIVGLLWPDLEQDRARAALRKAVFNIRRELGADFIVSRGAEELALGDAVAVDVRAFRESLAAGDAVDALRWYRGELMPAFHLQNSVEFEGWLETERAGLASRARAGVAQLVRSGHERKDPALLRLAAARAQEVGPEDEHLLRQVMQALHDLAHSAEALRAYEQARARWAREYELEPAAETVALAAAIASAAADSRKTAANGHPRVEPERGGAGFADDEDQADTNPLPSVARPGPEFRAAPGAVRRRWMTAAAASVIALSALLLRGGWETQAEASLPATAVVGVVTYLPDGSVSGAAVADMLATSIARIPGLQVLSSIRIYELAGDTTPSAIAAAARRAGAAQLLEGALHLGAADGYQLELRRVDAATGVVLASYSIAAPGIVEVVNRATVQLAVSLGLPAPSGSIADVTTSSLHAWEAYERGLRAYYTAGPDSARRWFELAVHHDSTFAMATWMLSSTLVWTPQWIPLSDRAVRLSERATERERLIIRASYAAGMNDPSLPALADSLARRYPAEPIGHLLQAEWLVSQARFLDAIPHLRRVVRLDTLSLLEITPRCTACDALWHIGAAYGNADSLAAQVRTWREWVRVQPQSADALSWLSVALEGHGEYDEAERVARHALTLDPSAFDLDARLAAMRIHQGRLDEADRLLRSFRQRPGSSVREYHRLITQLRLNQEQWTEALVHADSFRLVSPADRRLANGYLRGIVLLHQQDGRRAVALFDSLAAVPNTYTLQSRLGRDMAMNRTHAAEAYALLGDTARLRLLEDSVRAWGSMSGYVRDQLLHHHVRGLRMMLLSRYDDAAAAFEQARFGPRGSGYGRTNIMLARALIAAGRPHEAVRPLRHNLEAGVFADQTWASRTEARALLGIALGAGRP